MNAETPPAAFEPPPHGGRFSLASLMVAVTAVAILCGLAQSAPGPAAALAVTLPIAGVRTYLSMRHVRGFDLFPKEWDRYGGRLANSWLIALWIAFLAYVAGVSALILIYVPIVLVALVLETDPPFAPQIGGAAAALASIVAFNYLMLMTLRPLRWRELSGSERALLLMAAVATAILGAVAFHLL